MSSIRLDRVQKIYPDGQPALCGLDLEVGDGELLVLVGPSGAGKTTVLRLVAGLETPTRGRILLDGVDVTSWPPRRRDVAMVFQSPALYPHLTVAANLAFGPRLRGERRTLVTARVERTAGLLGLEDLLDRRPGELSGGQRQRVALGRALVRQPRVLLLDEPFAGLDAPLRVQLRAELARLHRETRTTILHVTHDQEEALALGDRGAVLRAGRLEQLAAPLDLYHRPASVFVAGFIGAPAMNFFRCTAHPDGLALRLESSGFTLGMPNPPARCAGEVLLGVRPHDLAIGAGPDADVRARVDLLLPLGSTLLVYTRLCCAADVRAVLAVPPDAAPRPGDEIGVSFRRDRLHLFDAHTGERLG